MSSNISVSVFHIGSVSSDNRSRRRPWAEFMLISFLVTVGTATAAAIAANINASFMKGRILWREALVNLVQWVSDDLRVRWRWWINCLVLSTRRQNLYAFTVNLQIWTDISRQNSEPKESRIAIDTREEQNETGGKLIWIQLQYWGSDSEGRGKKRDDLDSNMRDDEDSTKYKGRAHLTILETQYTNSCCKTRT